MLYPLIIATLANGQLEDSRRRAEHARRVRQVRDENRSAAAPGTKLPSASSQASWPRDCECRCTAGV